MKRTQDAVDTVIEESTPSPKRLRRKYKSVQEAAQHLQLLYRYEDTGASGFDPERAMETAGVDTSSAGYRDVGSKRMSQLRDLEAAFSAAWRRMCREHDRGDIDNHPDDLWRAWWGVRMEQRSKTDVAREIGFSRSTLNDHYLDRVDGYLESALRARDLWIDDRQYRETRNGYDAKQDYQDEEWDDGC